MNEDNNIENLNKDQEKDFNIPEGYFEALPGRLFSKIELLEELKEFPLLSGIKKQNAFIVPENYFETRDFAQALAGNENRKEARVINLPGLVKRYKLAIAAVFIMAIGTTVLYTVYNKGRVDKLDCGEIACLSKEDITSSGYFDQISIEELETVANGEMLDSMGKQVDNELLNELIADPDAINITDEDLGI